MEKRNLALDERVTGEQWDIVARTAQDMTPEDGFSWQPDVCHEIGVHMRADDAPASWRDWASSGDGYGAHPLRVATFVWNDGEPYARNDLELTPESPNVLPQDVERMQADFEHWVHNRWQKLWRASGIPYTDAGHVTQV